MKPHPSSGRLLSLKKALDQQAVRVHRFKVPAPIIVLPQQFKGTTLSQVAADVVSRVDGEGHWPEAITV